MTTTDQDDRTFYEEQRGLHPKWTPPPSDDATLRWRFCNADAELGLASGFGTIEALGLSGITVRGIATGDGKLINRRVVEFGFNPTAKLRQVDAQLAWLTQRQRDVLWLAYGPEAYLAQVKQRLGHWCGVALIADAARKPHTTHGKGELGAWLMQIATPVQVARVKTETNRLVWNAWNCWADARGRQKRVERVEAGAGFAGLEIEER